MLWVLIRNGTFFKNSVLCWDEPEANLNSELIKIIVEVLLELQRAGVQIFLATHGRVLLDEFDLQMNKSDKVKFHALYRNKKTRYATFQ